MSALSFGEDHGAHRALRARIEAEVREAERLRVDADELARRIEAEALATEGYVRRIHRMRPQGEGEGRHDHPV